MIMYVLVIRLSGVCNHRRDEKVGSPICLSRVRFQTELDKVFLQFLRKEKQPGYERKERNLHQKT